MIKYRILADLGLSDDAPEVDEIVVKCTKHDYGMQRDHENATGEEHINVSRDGEYPFYTIPLRLVAVIGLDGE